MKIDETMDQTKMVKIMTKITTKAKFLASAACACGSTGLATPSGLPVLAGKWLPVNPLSGSG